MTWKKVPLRSFCRTGSGTTPPRAAADRYYGGSIPWVKSGELREAEIFGTSESVTETALRETSLRLVPSGAILIAMYGATVGRVGMLRIDATTNQAICHIVPDPKVADTRFVYHCVTAHASYFISRGAGGAQPNITQRIVQDFEMVLPPLAEQRRLAAILDQADDLRRKRRTALEIHNTLPKAIFREMFVDAGARSHRFNRAKLSEVCKSVDDVRCGPFGTQLMRGEFTDTGVPLWGIRHVNSGFAVKTAEYVTVQKAKELMQYSLVADDIVMTRKGTVGNCAVYPHDFPPGIMHSDLLRVRVNPEVANPFFVSEQLRCSKDVQHQLSLISGGAIMPGINVGRLKSIEILIPPKPFQDLFAKRLQAVDVSRQLFENNLSLLDALFATLQHQAFAGTLARIPAEPTLLSVR